MIRRLTKLGLLLVALLSINAVGAAFAPAEAFDAEDPTTTFLTGSQEGTDVLGTTAGTISCSEITYAGSQPGPNAESLVLEPAFSGCTAFGFANATVDPNGCEYEIHASGNWDIQGCASASGIIITAKAFTVTKCTMTVPEQAGLEGASFSSLGEGSAREVTVDLAVENQIAYTHHAGSGVGACTSGSSSEGDYEGALTLAGEREDGEPVGIWWTA